MYLPQTPPVPPHSPAFPSSPSSTSSSSSPHSYPGSGQVPEVSLSPLALTSSPSDSPKCPSVDLRDTKPTNVSHWLKIGQ